MRRGYDYCDAIPDGLAVLTARPAPLHDQAGNMVYGPKPRDPANGMPCTNATIPARRENRLATVHWDDGDDTNQLDANDTLMQVCQYDGLNRRTVRVDRKPDLGPGLWMRWDFYHNESWQVVEERRRAVPIGADPHASIILSGSATSVNKQYAWDLRYIDAPICRWWDADADGQMEPTAGEQHYYTNDAQFSATALIDANSGSVVERYIYDPYGKPTVLDANWTPITASAYENEILYCGYRYDPETGLCQVRERYYDPATGTWKTRDRSGYVDGPSLYEYVRSNPPKLIDWDGKLGRPAVDEASTGHETPTGGATVVGPTARPARSPMTPIPSVDGLTDREFVDRLEERREVTDNVNSPEEDLQAAQADLQRMYKARKLEYQAWRCYDSLRKRDFGCKENLCEQIAKWINCVSKKADDYNQFLDLLHSNWGQSTRYAGIYGGMFKTRFEKQTGLKHNRPPWACCHGWQKAVRFNGTDNLRHFAGALQWGKTGGRAESTFGSGPQAIGAWWDAAWASTKAERVKHIMTAFEKMAEVTANTRGGISSNRIENELERVGPLIQEHRSDKAWKKVRGMVAKEWRKRFCRAAH